MKVIIDRFEGEYAIVEIEVGQYAHISKLLVPNAKEGDLVYIEIDKEDTRKRKEDITKLMNSVFEE